LLLQVFIVLLVLFLGWVYHHGIGRYKKEREREREGINANKPHGMNETANARWLL
jgi:hypothetical protein